MFASYLGILILKQLAIDQEVSRFNRQQFRPKGMGFHASLGIRRYTQSSVYWSVTLLSTAFSIARSGLAAEAVRVEVAASNIANASSPDYVPRQVEQATHGHSGGVTTTIRPTAGSQLSSTAQGVDIVREVTTLIQAQAAYEANLAVIVAVDQMTETLLDIVGDNDSDKH
ncbi:MAG: hypothetical protein JXQ99_07605 [Hyphomicrobiaceae bacterium]